MTFWLNARIFSTHPYFLAINIGPREYYTSYYQVLFDECFKDMRALNFLKIYFGVFFRGSSADAKNIRMQRRIAMFINRYSGSIKKCANGYSVSTSFGWRDLRARLVEPNHTRTYHRFSIDLIIHTCRISPRYNNISSQRHEAHSSLHHRSFCYSRSHRRRRCCLG
jgi:hypothetical protein